MKKARGDLEWKNRTEVMKKLDERRSRRKKEGVTELDDVVVVLPAKPGLGDWWKRCRKVEGLTELDREWAGEELKGVVKGGVRVVGGPFRRG